MQIAAWVWGGEGTWEGAFWAHLQLFYHRLTTTSKQATFKAGLGRFGGKRVLSMFYCSFFFFKSLAACVLGRHLPSV